MSSSPPGGLAPTIVEDAPPLGLDLTSGEIRTIVWATGFRPDYSWLDVPVLDRKGLIRHDGGVVLDAPGMYLMGMPFLRRRKSTLIDGAGDDAEDLSAHLASYLDGHVAAPPDAAGEPIAAVAPGRRGLGPASRRLRHLSEPANCRSTWRSTIASASGRATVCSTWPAAPGSPSSWRRRSVQRVGIDASPRLIAVARDRNPHADLRVGDMQDLPWPDASFDVVTSFRGIWGTTPDAVAEAHRVLAPGGRLGITVWGHIKRSPGAWALAPLTLASEPKVEHQAAMVALGRPGRGEELLARCGFVDVERHEIPFVWEFADPEAYARAMSSVGPAYEAIQDVGEEEFVRSAIAVARQRVREGLPLRAPIAAVGYVARKPSTAGPALTTPSRRRRSSTTRRPRSAPSALFDQDLKGLGYVMNSSKLWAHDPAALDRCPTCSVTSARPGHSPTVNAPSSSRRAPRPSATRTARWRGASGWPARPATRSPSACFAATTSRSTTRAGARPLGPPARPRSELDDGRRRGVAARRRLPRRSDLRHLRVRGPAHRLLHRQRRLGAQPDRQLGADAPAAVRDAVTFGRPVATSELEVTQHD